MLLRCCNHLATINCDCILRIYYLIVTQHVVCALIFLAVPHFSDEESETSHMLKAGT